MSLDTGAVGTGFGIAGNSFGSAADVEELNKALTAGYGRGGDTTDGGIGAPLRPESLEATLKVVTYNERHIVFWRDIPKLPAFNTVEEANVLNSYGNSGGMFVPEGIAPSASDSTYTRKTFQVKYVGSLRSVSFQMSLVRPAHGDVVALETINGTKEMLRAIEQKLFTGDSSCVAEEWDGIEKQFTDGLGATDGVENIIDMRGAAVDEATLGEAARIVIGNFGFPTAMYLGYQQMTDLNNSFLSKERIMQPNAQPGTAGFALTSYQTTGGVYGLKPSLFLNPGGVAPAASVGPAASVPSTSGVTIAVTDAGADATSQFGAGTYAYGVVLENRFGTTAVINAVSGADVASVAIGAGHKISLAIKGLSGTTATAVQIFRTTGVAGTGSLTFMKRVKLTPSSGTATIVDLDLDIPGTAKAYLLQVDLDVMSFKQLAPFTKIPLATIDPSIRWMQLLFGTPAVYAPKKIVMLKNIGRAS